MKVRLIILGVIGILSISLTAIGVHNNEVSWSEDNKIMVQLGVLLMIVLLPLSCVLIPHEKFNQKKTTSEIKSEQK